MTAHLQHSSQIAAESPAPISFKNWNSFLVRSPPLALFALRSAKILHSAAMLSIHQQERPIRLQAVGATLLYLPPYSPDLNPIEQAFSKLKAHLRKAAETTVPGLLRRIGRVLTTFSPHDAEISCVTRAMLAREWNSALIAIPAWSAD